MKHYNYTENTDALEVIAVDVPEGEPYHPYYDGLAKKKAKLLGKKLAGGSFDETCIDMLNKFIADGGVIHNIKAGTKPLIIKPDARKAKPLLEWMEDISEYEWEYITEYLTELMKNNEYWKATVNNFGWRNQDGYKYFKATDGSELLKEILPDTDCHFKIFRHGKGLKLQNFHHDSPTGNEWYYLIPIKQSTYENNT